MGETTVPVLGAEDLFVRCAESPQLRDNHAIHLFAFAMPNQAVVNILQSCPLNLMAVYALGTCMSGDAHANSDWAATIARRGRFGISQSACNLRGG